jgi:membrane fusion protein (multidrug efflux system)
VNAQPRSTAADATVPVDAEPLPAESALAARRRWRRPLMLIGPLLVLLIGGYFFIMGGRYVETENAYVKSDKVTISAAVAGPIASVNVAENQPVQRQALLFTLEQRPFRIALDRAEAELRAVASDIAQLQAELAQKEEELVLAETNLAFAVRELARQEKLAARQMASQEALDSGRHTRDGAQQRINVLRQERLQILAQLENAPRRAVAEHPRYLAARAVRDAAALDLERTEVRSPVDGFASRVPLAGQYLQTGAAAMSVVADASVWVDANFPETDLTHVAVGQPASIRIDTYPGRTWHGEVLSISRATGSEFAILPPQNASGNWVKVVQRIPVRISLQPERDGPALRAGMSATVEIDTGHQRPLLKHLGALFGATGADGNDVAHR